MTTPVSLAAADRRKWARAGCRVLVFTTAREPNATLAQMLRERGHTVLELCGTVTSLERLVDSLTDLDAAVVELGLTPAACLLHVQDWRRAGWAFPVVVIAGSEVAEGHGTDAASVVLGRKATLETIAAAVARMIDDVRS